MKPFKQFQRRYCMVIAAALLAGVMLLSWAAISVVAKLFSPNAMPTPQAIAISTQSPSPPNLATSPPLIQATKPIGYEPKLGHFPYDENSTQDMSYIGSYAEKQNQRFERLSLDAALALMKLIYVARTERIWIVPVSGFRSVTQQEKLYKAQIQRKGSETSAAKVSAPPGYSEHHTGYAVDLADGNYPQEDISFKFAETEASRWLNLHAREFGFELSFPKNNSQGVSYEPWHWRFIGSSQAETVFQQARSNQPEKSELQ
jgi:zinc D-Ala-D-Ala carboxypeptidase